MKAYPRRSPLELVGLYQLRLLEEPRPTYHDLEDLPGHLPYPERITRRTTSCGRSLQLTTNHTRENAATILPLRLADRIGRPCGTCAAVAGRLL